MAILLNSNITTTLNDNVYVSAIEPYIKEAIDIYALDKQDQLFLKEYKSALDKIYLSITAKEQDSIIFNSCSNESTSQIYLSAYMSQILTGRKNSIILFERAPLDELKVARFLESQGCRVHRIPSTIDGTIDIEILKSYINEKTAFVSVPMVDDESGVIQPLEEVSQICALHNVPLYSNASWAVGKIPVDVTRLPVSYLSLEGALIHGPKDIAMLYIKEDAPPLLPIVYGSDLEQNGLRAMPKNLSSIIGLGKALEDAIDALDYEMEDVRDLRDDLEQGLLEIDGSYSLAPWALRVPTVAIMAFEGVHASMLLERLAKRDILAYSYARFNTGNFERKSLVEIAGLDSSLKHSVIGFALNIYNTKDEIEQTIEAVKEEVAKIRLEFSGNICKESK